MKLKRMLTLICQAFTIVTLFSGIINLIIGNTTDTHLHIINRFMVCVICISSLSVFIWLRDKTKFATLIHYVGTLMIILFYVWLNSFIEELGKTAYRDIFLNYTGIYIVFSFYEVIKSKIVNKQAKHK
ncbi:hypothetical protein PV797_06420 [Clostridiaceae bacterium M8S5]|nr:hypothetical protein PV797_06420 [Clostridiaceae bacterium M8S5]